MEEIGSKLKVYNIQREGKEISVVLDRGIANLFNLRSSDLNRNFKRSRLTNKVYKLTNSEYFKFFGLLCSGFKPTAYPIDGCIALVDCFRFNSYKKYKEKIYEKQIIKSFKKQGFKLIGNKVKLSTRAPDLIFTKDEKIFIVEVQIGILDKNHIYRSLEYRDLFFIKHNIKPEIILVSEDIKTIHLPILKLHGINFISQKNETNPEISYSKERKNKEELRNLIKQSFKEFTNQTKESKTS